MNKPPLKTPIRLNSVYGVDEDILFWSKLISGSFKASDLPIL